MSKIVAEIEPEIVAETEPETESDSVDDRLVEQEKVPKKRGQPADPVAIRKEKQRLLGVLKYYQAKDAYKQLLAMPREDAEKLATRKAVKEAVSTTPKPPATTGSNVDIAELLGLAKEKAKRKKLKSEVRALQTLIAQAMEEPEASSPVPEPEQLRTATPPRSTSPADWFGLPVGQGTLLPSSRRRR